MAIDSQFLIQNGMTYKEQLHPWCIIKPLPNLKRQIVARCRRRNDAEAHLKILQRMIPGIKYTIVFDPTPDQSDLTAKQRCSSPI